MWYTYGTADLNHGIVCMLRKHDTELNDPVVTADDTDDGEERGEEEENDARWKTEVLINCINCLELALTRTNSK